MIFRTLSDRTTAEEILQLRQDEQDQPWVRTFFFSDVFERKSQPGILFLNDTDLSESTFPDHAK